MWSVLWTNTIELTYEILGIRPLLIDKLSNYCIPKDGVLLPRMDSYSSVLPLIVDPFIISGCNYYGLRRSILIIEAEGGDSRAWGLCLATVRRSIPNILISYTLMRRGRAEGNAGSKELLVLGNRIA
jgi:hypothetical protein